MTTPAAKRTTKKPSPTKARATKRSATRTRKAPTVPRSPSEPSADRGTRKRTTQRATSSASAKPARTLSPASSAKQRSPQRSISSTSPARSSGAKTRGARRTSSPPATPKRGKRATPVTRRRADLSTRARKKAASSAHPSAGTTRVPSGARSSKTRAPHAGQAPKAAPKKPTKAQAPQKKPAQKKTKKRPLSRKPAAVAARKRRQERKAIEEQKRARRNERRRQKRKEKAGKVDERDLAIGWLEHIREDFATIVPTSLTLTEPEAAAKTPWLVVGRYDFLEEVDYATLAEMLEVVANDVLLEAKIHPQRLSQIRVVYHDPHSKRGEGDSIVSKSGAWEFIIGDLIGEIVGGGPEDEGALAVRYAETTIPTLYIYFSSEIMAHATIAPWQTTATIKIKK